MSEYDSYQSPYSWRYASEEMRQVWSETHKRQLWRHIWVTLASVQQHYGLVSPEQVQELKAAETRINIPRALEIESQIHHDLMAEVKTFAEQCPTAGGIIHLGATSMDIEDNADALRMREASGIILSKLQDLLQVLANLIRQTANLPVMAYTHIQPAEPTTLGYRFSMYAQDLLEDYQHLQTIRRQIRGKGFKGAVGTAAAYIDLIGAENYLSFEQQLSQALDLPFYNIATQTYPRKQDYQVISALAGLGASFSKLAFDLRLLQTPPIGEISEPFGSKQVGSSAMPFKRNPINNEKIDSLARELSVFPQVAWNNAAQSLLERTLDDSANRRSLLPETFLICDELLRTATRVLKGINIHEAAIQRNLETYAPFAATERVMMAAVQQGGNRQELHERLREHSLAAWQDVQAGRPNTLKERLQHDPDIQKILQKSDSDALMDISTYTGIAPDRARAIADQIDKETAA